MSKSNNGCGIYGIVLCLIAGIILAIDGNSAYLFYLVGFITILFLFIYMMRVFSVEKINFQKEKTVINKEEGIRNTHNKKPTSVENVGHSNSTNLPVKQHKITDSESLNIYKQENNTTAKFEIQKLDNKYGLKDLHTNCYILPPEYDEMIYKEFDGDEQDDFEDGNIGLSYILICKGLISEKCYILDFDFEHTYYCVASNMMGIKSNGKYFFTFKKSGKFGFCNNRGKELIAQKYDRIGDLSARNTGVFTWGSKSTDNFKYEIIDLESKNVEELILPMGFGRFTLSSFREDMAIIQNENKKFGLINKKGELIYPCTSKIKPTIDIGGIAIVEKGDMYFPLSKNGEKLTNLNYDFIGKNFHGFLLTKTKDYFGVIRENGQTILRTTYDEIVLIAPYELEVFRVLKIGKISFINSQEQLVNTDFFDYSKLYTGNVKFINGMLRVKKNGLVGYLNEKFEEVIPCKYNSGSRVLQGRILVEENGERFFIDKTGERLKYISDYDGFPFEEDERLIGNYLEKKSSAYKI